jgi:hypothetical protein
MTDTPLAEPRLFKGDLSLATQTVVASATIGILPSGELSFDVAPLRLCESSKFILTEWTRGGSDIVHFSFRGTSDDGALFETDELFFSSIGPRSGANGAQLELKAECSKGIFRYALKQAIENPVLRLRIKGFRNLGSLHSECELGHVAMNGPSDLPSEDIASGWLAVQALAMPPDLTQWRTECEKLLEHVRRIMSLAASALLRAPVMEFIAGTTSEVTVLSQSPQRASGLALIHFLANQDIFEAAVRSHLAPPIAVKHLFFAIEWFAMEATYNEVRLVNAMTALENLIDSNIEPDEALILKRTAFEKTRRVLLSVIRACLSKWDRALADDASRELNEKLADLNRRSLLRKLDLLAARWGVPLNGIDPAHLKSAKQARDKVVHRGQYYEDAKETDVDLWTHLTVIRELAVRFFFTAIGYKGRYLSYVGGYHDAVFPPPTDPIADVHGTR